MGTYTYTIFDANPHTSGGTAWPSHTDIEIEAESDEDALEEVRDALSVESSRLSVSDGYDVGQRLYALLWDSEGILVGEPTYDLTEEDLGVDESQDETAGVV